MFFFVPSSKLDSPLPRQDEDAAAGTDTELLRLSGYLRALAASAEGACQMHGGNCSRCVADPKCGYCEADGLCRSSGCKRYVTN